ncbi:MAG: RluA family pseudouridine synthase [Myxococcota bacterium]
MASERGTVAPGDAGTRLDTWLATHTSVGSRGRAKKALASGKVRVDDRPVGTEQAGIALEAGAIVEIQWARPGTAAAPTAARQRLTRAGVRLLFVDDAMVVADKPAGLLTDTATRAQQRNRECLRAQLRTELGFPVWPVHRIDRDTTGVVAFARSESLYEALRAQWAAQTPERTYLAVVEGLVEGEAGRWADWMAWDARKHVQRASREGAPHAVLAQADWRVLGRGRHLTALEVRLVTGRRNQIRVHAMLRGHPLVGEVQYRDAPAKRARLPRQALHARRLALDHPVTGERLSFEAPVPDDLRQLLRGVTDAL